MSKKMGGRLYKAARGMNVLDTLASGDPKKILRRGKNDLLGRLQSTWSIWL